MDTATDRTITSSSPAEFDLQSESMQCKTRLQTFTADLMQTLRVSSPDMMALMQADRSRRDKNVYFYLPFCFAQSFNADVEALRRLSYAGILWMSYARFQDDVIDRSAAPSATHMFLKDMYLIESLRQMHAVFPAGSPYWSYFSRYHAQFVAAVTQEKYKESDPQSRYSDEDFRTIAAGKAAMAKCAVAALGCLGRCESRIAPLERAIDAYHIAYQLYDDVVDWKADVAVGARTQLLDILKSRLPVDARALPPETMAGHLAHALHYGGIADRYLAHAQRLCEESSELAGAEGCRIWVGNVQRLHTVIAALQSDLRSLVQTNVLSAREREEQRSGAAASITRGPDTTAAAAAALRRAVEYIVDRQHPDGTWVDFLHGGTRSVEWTTAYVGMQLKDAGLGRSALDRAAHALCRRHHPDGGWGWSLDITPVDADSTSCALVFLSDYPEFDADARRRALIRMQQFHDPARGGYSTYTDGPQLRAFLGRNHPRSASVKGWCSSQVCVTSVAVEAQLGYPAVDADQVTASLAFLRASQTDEGFWHAYWWDGALYSTCHCLHVLGDFAEPQDEDRIDRALRWIASVQSDDGGWGGTLPGRNRAFNTALAVDALLLRAARPEYRQSAERGVAWLIRHQYADGSWPGGRILRIPRPHSLTPWTRGDWKESPTELNVLLRDTSGLFTASTVVHALNTAVAASA